ncbi:tryptophan--tRNA ligase [Castellaniella hirudinis]|uniref:tryptophan--tRNA ligase n=1 Tax=Castellaniella hirudinis TaxID=1144617 RepID=UPI0039C08396
MTTTSPSLAGRRRVLTGITTSGTPHLGNYAGAIRPAIQSSIEPDVDAFFFLADYHALIKCGDPLRVAQSRMEIAATWIAAGLDTDRVTFYRQSDIPEIPELCWMLTCVTAKGLMNRAHAYKASVDANLEKGEEPDDGVTMGLFSYPILMAADILMFNAHRVPVGRDQIQHLEMARDIAQRFNHLYGQDLFVLPAVQIDEDVATLPGLDGRKMSKSYHNTIPLFEGGARALKAAVAQIVTDSRLPGEPKDADSAHLFTLYRAFATHAQADAFKQALADGLGWGEAKQALCRCIEDQIGPMRDNYARLMANPGRIEDILQAGAEKARRIAVPFMDQLRAAVGLRQPAAAGAAGGRKTDAARAGKAAQARLVSFREADGGFRQRLFAADGAELLLSEPFADPKQLNQLGRQVAQLDFAALAPDADGQVSLAVAGQCWARCLPEALPRVQQALASL